MKPNQTISLLFKLPPIALALMLQFAPLAKVVQSTAFVSRGPLAIVLQWTVGAAALLGSCHAVSGASASITGLRQYVGNTAVGVVTTNVMGTNGVTFRWRFALSGVSIGSGDYFSATGLPPGLMIDTNLNGLGFITNSPSAIPSNSVPPGVYAVRLRADHQGCNCPVYKDVTITIAAGSGGGATPPTITAAPTNYTAITGGNAAFSVTASGTAPLTYQWRFNSSPLGGQTNASLSLVGLTSGNAGPYDVVVANSAGSVTSAVATLTVLVPPSISASPQNSTVTQGATANFSVMATGTAPFNYQWRFNTTNLVGQTNSTLSLANVVPARAGQYDVVVTNVAGSVISAAAILTVQVPPGITAQPQSVSALAGGSVNFSVTASGTAPYAYQWRFNGTNLVGQTGSTLSLSGIGAGHGGPYTVVITNVAGSVTSSPATLTVLIPPSLATQPQSATVIQGGATNFTVLANGTAPLSYQWLRNGTALGGQTAATLAMSSIVSNQSGGYSVLVSNVAGSVTSVVATLTVLVPPTITSGPVNQSVVAGSNATFAVAVAGTAPFTYQWFLNGGKIPGAGSTLILSNVIANQAGNYSVTVSNVAGVVTSAAATLTVGSGAAGFSISTPPQSRTVPAGTNVTFSVGVTGTGPFTYQWNKNGGAIGSATSSTLSLTNVSTNDTANYTVTVSDGTTPLTSTPATLAVLTRPQIISASRQSDGTYRVVLNGMNGRTNTLQASTNLTTWVNVTNVVSSGGAATLIDGQAPQFSYRYYRVWMEVLYATNVVGYSVATLPPGYSIVANQFVGVQNTVGAVFSNVPNGTAVMRFQNGTGDYAINTYDGDFQLWDAPSQPFGWGVAAFVYNPTATNLMIPFQGEVPQGDLGVTTPTGYSMMGNLLPVPGLLQTDLGFVPRNGDAILAFRRGGYIISQFDPDFQEWDAEPRVGVSEGFFLWRNVATNWTKTFIATP